MTTGVLLMAYGSPGSLEEVGEYLAHIRGGRTPSEEAVEELRERYRSIGGRSPLKEITERQARALEGILELDDPGTWRTYVGMKHWHPFITDAVAKMAADGVDEAVGLALAPHYSGMSIGGYERQLREAAQALGDPFDVEMIPHWYDVPCFVAYAAANLNETLAGWDTSDGATRVFFTAHSLPERILEEGDPYREQLLESSRLTAAEAQIEDWEFAFQSASAAGEPWLGPDILEALESFAREGGRRAVIAPIGFTADHLEILYDVDVECRDQASEAGLAMRRIPSPNYDPNFISCLADVVRRAVGRGPPGG